MVLRDRNSSKNHLESNLGPILMLSWLARLKFGVKMAMLTPFGGLRGTKFVLRDALGATK